MSILIGFNHKIGRGFLLMFLAFFLPASGQKANEKAFPIPEEINNIFQATCLPCHGSMGGRFPTARLNFARWEGYGAAREMEKASAICKSVTKGTMPPKSTKGLRPARMVLTKEEIGLICKWADSLKPAKGNKPQVRRSSPKVR